jgi:hypothetical protein
MIESLIAFALVLCVRAELAFLQLLPEPLGGVEERPICGKAVPTAQAATGSLFSIICHRDLLHLIGLSAS